MKYYYFFFILLVIISSCNKTPRGDYFQCQVDGQFYTPDACSSCTEALIYGDTLFAVNAYAGVTVIGIGVSGSPFLTKNFTLDQHLGGNGQYKSSYAAISNYLTDSLRTGTLQITSIDNIHRKVEGTFSFKAYNSFQNKIINITSGKFKLPYKNY